jgi:hypothetical protein
MNTNIFPFTSRAMNFLSKGTFHCPSLLVKSVPQNHHWKSDKFSPLSYSMILSLESNKYVTSPIRTLFLRSSPSAIIRSIMTFIVNSIKLVERGWCSTYVQKKSVIGSNPLFAYLNTTSAIPWVIISSWFETSIFHRLPSSVFFAKSPAHLSSLTYIN